MHHRRGHRAYTGEAFACGRGRHRDVLSTAYHDHRAPSSGAL